jgi:hypothetical protein
MSILYSLPWHGEMGQIDVTDLLDTVQRATGIDPDRILFYHQGKRVYKINLESADLFNPLQVLEASFEGVFTARFEIRTNISLDGHVRVENKDDKTLFDVLVEICLKYNIFHAFNQEFTIKNTKGEFFDILAPLNALNPSETLTISAISSEETLSINIQMPRNKETVFKCSQNFRIESLKTLVALFLKTVPHKITLKYNSSPITAGTIESHNIEEDDYISVLLNKTLESLNSNTNLKKGITWTAICTNNDCKLYKTPKSYPTGFGVFDISREPVKDPCSECQQRVKITDFCFYKARYCIEGVIEITRQDDIIGWNYEPAKSNDYNVDIWSDCTVLVKEI